MMRVPRIGVAVYLMSVVQFDPVLGEETKAVVPLVTPPPVQPLIVPVSVNTESTNVLSLSVGRAGVNVAVPLSLVHAVPVKLDANGADSGP